MGHKIATAIILILGIVLLSMVAQMLGMKVKVTDIVDIRTEEQKATYKESEEDVERIAAFVTHTACVMNDRACAGSDVEWMTTCAFIGSQNFTGVSNTVNFERAYTFAPYTDRDPYKLSRPERFPYYRLRLGRFESIVADSVLDSIEESGHLGSYQRIKDQIVVPFLKYGTKAKGFPAKLADICGRVVKMGRSQLAGLHSQRKWPRNEVVQRHMREAGFAELIRITDEVAQKSERPGRVYGDPFIFYGER